MSTSYFLHNEPCPDCRRNGKDKHGDNLGVFSDGHKYCWSCGYKEGASVAQRAASLSREESPISLPKTSYDKYFCKELDTKCLTFLLKYGISSQEAKEYDLCFDRERELLIFHYPDWSFYCGRYLGFNPKHSKYTSFGSKFDSLYLFQGESVTNIEEVILVEDWVSAIKLSRVVPAFCLFGTAPIALELIIRLSKRFSKIGIWLDMDKAKESLLERSKASGLFDQARSIVTEKDPKCYSTEQIKEILIL